MNTSHPIRSAARAVVESLESRQLLAVAAPSYIAIADANQNNGNTRRAISYYNVEDITADPATASTEFGQRPDFVGWVGFEINAGVAGGPENFEELTAFTVNPANGDTYQLAFDSTNGGEGVGIPDSVGDNLGDYDLYRINVGRLYADFLGNARAKGIMYTGTVAPDGFNYQSAYGNRPNGPTGLPAVSEADLGVPFGRDNTDADPANDFLWLTLATEKIGEIARTQGDGTTEPPFFNEQDLQFVDADTLLLTENIDGNNLEAQVKVLRSRPTPATAGPGPSGDPQDLVGGYNPLAVGVAQPDYPTAGTRLATENWEGVALAGRYPDGYLGGGTDGNTDTATNGFFLLDGVGTSEIDGMRYTEQDGVRGVWVSERDSGTGDEFAFYEIDFANLTLTLRELRVGAGPFPTDFNLDQVPANNDNTGVVGFFDVDESGNLIIEERNAFDATPDEPQIITREITDYDVGDDDGNGINEVGVGGFDATGAIVLPVDDDGTPIDVSPNTRAFGVYERGGNFTYIFDVDSGNAADVYVVDSDPDSATFGQVVYAELDAVNHFLNDANVIRAFTLGDYAAQDGLVGAADIDRLFDLVADPTDGGRLTAATGVRTFDLNDDGVLTGRGANATANGTDSAFLVRRVIGTEFGDANLDGRVNLADFGILRANFGQSGGWANGDFNGDETVNLSDFGILRQFFGFSI